MSLLLRAVVPAFAGLLMCSQAAAGASTWHTFGYDAQRTGFNPDEQSITAATAPSLRLAWKVGVRGHVNAQPTAAGVEVDGRRRTLVYVGTEHGYLYALRLSDGRQVWRRSLGFAENDCPNSIDSKYGISGAPYLDLTQHRVYVVSSDGLLHALDMATGKTIEGWPVRVTENPENEHAWSAVNVSRGRVYVTFGSYCDQRNPYHGKVVAVSVRRHRLAAEWYVTGRDGPSGGGIWGWGGVSVDPRDGDVYAASGNALAEPTSYPFAERVLRLSRDLELESSHYPGDPTAGRDGDFGTTPVLYQVPGCPPHLAAMQKAGIVYIYERDEIDKGPVQQVQVSDPTSRLFIGMLAFSPRTRSLYVGNPVGWPGGGMSHGLVALKVGANCRARLSWQARAGKNRALVAPPIVAGDVVYYGANHEVWAFDARTGNRLWRSRDAISGSVIAAPTVVRGRLVAASWRQQVYTFALAAPGTPP